VVVGAVFFVCGALAGWLFPNLLGMTAVAAVYLTGVAVELGVNAGIIWIVVKIAGLSF
jgi:hypothetical protein